MAILHACGVWWNFMQLKASIHMMGERRGKKESNDAHYWYVIHFKGTGIGTGIIIFKQDLASTNTWY